MKEKDVKLVRNFYYTSKGEKKINSYHINLPKEIIGEVNYEEVENVRVYTQDNKIIIEKA